MAQQVGDLWPYASGAASLGAEQINGPQAGFTSEIRPFNHVHLNSGVWHDPLNGQSGVIRFNQSIGGFEYSVNGGLTFRKLFIDLQGAYDNGHKIDQTHRPAPAYLLSSSLRSQHDPVVIGYTDPGAGNSAGYNPLEALRDASIVASGFSLTPNLTNTFAFTAILPGHLQMQGSGLPGTHPTVFSITCGDIGTPFILAQASGFMIWNSTAGLIFSQNGNGDVLMQNVGDSKGNGGQIKIEAFNGSGNLQYRLGGIGGHQAWHWKPSYASTGGPNNDGYFPIPHSGQILAMILQNSSAGSTLQSAYEANNNVFTSLAQGGPVNIAGTNTYGLGLYQQDGGHPHMLVSGVSALVTTGLVRGAMWLQGHTAGTMIQLQGLTSPTSAAEASARSLGIETVFIHAGSSGIVHLRPGSGIIQCFNSAPSASITEVGINAPIDRKTTPDTWYGNVTLVSGIKPWVPGMYRITYTAVLEKPLGNLAQVVGTELRFWDKIGNQFRLLGSSSAAYLRDNNALSFASANGQWVGDLRDSISIFLFMQTSEAPPAGNSVRARSRACNIVIEWLGPLAGGQVTVEQIF